MMELCRITPVETSYIPQIELKLTNHDLHNKPNVEKMVNQNKFRLKAVKDQEH